MEPRMGQDALVMNDAGKIYKVQVKGTRSSWKAPDRKEGRYKIQPTTGRAGKKPVDCTKLDILVGYVQPYDAFYIIPCLDLNHTKSLWLYPHKEGSTAKWEVYRDRWDYFKR